MRKAVVWSLLVSLLSAPVWAEDASVGLAKRSLCYVNNMLDSTLGMFVGFVLALYGLWTIIRGSMGYGILIIIGGALLTAAPVLISSFLSGTQDILESSGISRQAGRDVGAAYGEAFSYKNRCEDIVVDMSAYIQPPPGQQAGQPGGVGTVGGSGGDRSLVRGAFGNDALGGCNKQSGASSQVVTGTVTSCYGVNRGTHYHGGVDIAGNVGDKVGAFADGEVIYADWSGGYGKHILVRHDDGKITSYGHLDGFNVKAGERVSAGQQIGTLGNTGRSSGPHLDFEYRDANNNKLNPCLHTKVCG